MPNWCLNKVVVKSLDGFKSQEKLDAVIHALNLCNVHDSLEFFNSIKPRPSIYNEDWYEWNVANWGTKWGAKELLFYVSDNRREVEINFDTAWSPPTPILDAIHELGLDVQAEFYEQEGGYEGTYNNGIVKCTDLSKKEEQQDQSSYTKEEMNDFMKSQNIEWATKGVIGSPDAYIELYNDETGSSLCKYPWDSSRSLLQAISFLMDMHKEKGGDSDYANA